MITGPGRIDRRTLDLIRGVLARYPEISRAILFGSRALGTAHRASDIDIAIDGVESRLQGEAIRSSLEELPLPYRFDVIPMHSIRNAALREHIDRFGVRIDDI